MGFRGYLNMITIYYVFGPDDDPYHYVSLTKPESIESFEGMDTLEILSVYHFFECVNINRIENGEKIFKQLISLYNKGKLPLI
jgi:hypothetical protein